MTEPDMLQWSALGRGVVRLLKKTRPMVRAASGLLRTQESDCTSLGELLERTAAAHAHEIALKYEDQALTYEDFNRRVNRIAHELIDRGMRPGDTAAVFMSNRPALLAVVAAVAKVGGTAAMLNTHQREHVLRHSISCCKPALYVIGEELVDAFEDVRPLLDQAPSGADTGEYRALYFVPDQGQRAAPAGYIDLDEAARAASPLNPGTTARVRAGDPCFYIFTSGTTGLPKASIMSHLRWLKAGAVFANVCLDLQPGETVYAPLPLYHNQALTLGWSCAVTRGAALATRRTFSASRFWDDCRRLDASAFVYIGEVPRYLLNQPESDSDRQHPVRRIIGVGLRPEIWQAFKERFGIDEIYEIYSASELNVAFLNAMNLDRTVGFCPLPWALVKFDVDAGQPVRDPRGRMIRVGKGETGLLLTKVSKRFQFDGYTDGRASEEKLFRDVFKDGDVWVNTGDLMRNIGFGHLQFVDRAGDTFRWKSENVSTGEVENVLNNMEAIAESTVYGVTIPGTEGRAGMAAVVPAQRDRPDRDDRDAELVNTLLPALRKQLPGYAIPVFIRVVDSLAVTGTFKHRKVALRKQGYDPSQTADPIYALVPGASEYQRLTPAMYADITARRYRF